VKRRITSKTPHIGANMKYLSTSSTSFKKLVRMLIVSPFYGNEQLYNTTIFIYFSQNILYDKKVK
jgi:hypothetical protein